MKMLRWFTVFAFLLLVAGASFGQEETKAPAPPADDAGKEAVKAPEPAPVPEKEAEKPPLPAVEEKEPEAENQKPAKSVELPEYVVTPGRSEEPVTGITEHVTVITAGQLEDSAAIDVTEVLREVPGLHLRQQGALGSTSVPFLRGTLGTQTIVLIDGIQVNDPTLGSQFDFDDLDVSNIERIEVIRGMEAAMYGPGAVGGVINIITRLGKGEPHTFARLLGGSYGTGHAQFGTAGSKNGFSHSFAISQLTADNLEPYNQTDKTTFSGKMRFDLDENRRIDIMTRYVSSRHEDPFEFFSANPFLGTPAYIETDHNILRRQDQMALGSKYSQKVSSVLSWNAFFSIYDSVSRFLNDSDDGSATPEFNFTAEATVLTGRMETVWNLDKVFNTPGRNSRLIIGGEATWEDTLTASSYGLTPDQLQNRAGYAHCRLGLAKWLLVSGGLRVDGHSTYGTNRSPAAGVKLLLWDGASVKCNWSTAYRPPSNVELTDPWYGNPDLKKERRSGFDAGILQKLLSGKIKMELTYFQTKIDDNIAYDSDTYRMENYDTFAEGLEAFVGIAPDKETSLGFGFTHVATRDLKKHVPLPGRSPNFGSFRMSRSFGKATFTVTGYFSEKVPPEGVLDEKGRAQKNAGKVDLVNFALLYKLGDKSKLIFKVSNIFDKRYKESERAPSAPGIGFYFGLSAQF